MFSYQDNSTFVDLARGSRYPKSLTASRWAPGRIDDQMASNKMINDKLINEKMASNNGSAFGAKALTGSPRLADPDERNQIGTKKMKKATKAKKKNKKSNKKNSSTTMTQQRKGTNKHEMPLSTTTNPTNKPCRRVPEEEEAVIMENQFFNADKNKGLGSSRWASE